MTSQIPKHVQIAIDNIKNKISNTIINPDCKVMHGSAICKKKMLPRQYVLWV